jgi:hypothetical protein
MSDLLPGSLPSSYSRASIHELSSSDDDDELLQPVASTSAIRLHEDAPNELADSSNNGEAHSSGLRERRRAPYSATLPLRKEVLNMTNSPISANTSKGKQRMEEPASSSEDTAAVKSKVEDETSPFSCHICLETPSSDDCVVRGHLSAMASVLN